MATPMTGAQFVRDALWDRYLDVDSDVDDFIELIEAGVDPVAFVIEATGELRSLIHATFAEAREVRRHFVEEEVRRHVAEETD